MRKFKFKITFVQTMILEIAYALTWKVISVQYLNLYDGVFPEFYELTPISKN